MTTIEEALFSFTSFYSAVVPRIKNVWVWTAHRASFPPATTTNKQMRQPGTQTIIKKLFQWLGRGRGTRAAKGFVGLCGWAMRRKFAVHQMWEYDTSDIKDEEGEGMEEDYMTTMWSWSPWTRTVTVKEIMVIVIIILFKFGGKSSNHTLFLVHFQFPEEVAG